MPGGDRTGPLGQGSMTGRGTGFCAGYGVAGFQNSGAGFGYGRGRGYCDGGRGWRHMFFTSGRTRWARRFGIATGLGGYTGQMSYGDYPPEREMEILRAQSNVFQKEIDVLNDRIRELEEIMSKNSGASSL